MDTDRIDLLHQPYFKHVVEPCGIDRTHSPQQHLLAMFVDDISRLPHKIPEDPPVRIEPVVVLTGVVGFIPELYPFAVVTIEVQNLDRKSTRLNSSHVAISYAVFCLKTKRSL